VAEAEGNDSGGVAGEGGHPEKGVHLFPLGKKTGASMIATPKNIC